MKTKVAELSAIPEGKAHCVKLNGAKILLSRTNGHVYAIENKCPHFGLPLGKGKIENGAIVCPFHGSRFDLATGENTDWVSSVVGVPIPGWTSSLIAMGRKPQGVKTWPVTVEDEDVYIDL